MTRAGAAHRPSGLFLESTPDERYGVLPGEDRPVREVMRPEVVTVPPSASLREAAAIMRDRQAEELVVCDGGRLLGILTAHDLVADGVATPRPPESIPVHTLLPPGEPAACRDDAILADAARAMSARRLRSVPVVNAAGTVVGVISLLDVAGAVMPNVARAWLAGIHGPR